MKMLARTARLDGRLPSAIIAGRRCQPYYRRGAPCISSITSVEGPERVTVLDVARASSRVSGKHVTAFELPRGEWAKTMLAAGMSENHARLITDLYDAHNAGKIDVEAGMSDRRFGMTTLPEVIASLLSAPGHMRVA